MVNDVGQVLMAESLKRYEDEVRQELMDGTSEYGAILRSPGCEGCGGREECIVRNIAMAKLARSIGMN